MAPLLDRLESLDRRWIFLVVLLAVLLPLFKPIGLPITPRREVLEFAAAIDSIPEGATVYLAADYDPGSMAELQPMLETAVRHLCRRQLKIITGCLWQGCPPLVERVMRDVAEGEFGLKYGVDYLNLGFKEGREVVMVQVGENLRSAYPADATGRPLDEFPIMNGIRGLAGMPLLVNISAGYPGTKEWVQQVRSRFNIPMVSGCTAVSTPEYQSYYQSGQLSGLLGGLAGAAQYEKLERREGTATRGMDAQSLGHLAIIFFILVGNGVYLVRRFQGGAA